MMLHPHAGFDNAAAPYRHIEALPLAAAMGAEIRGVNVAQLSDAAFAEIEHALFRHKMIFFRAQHIGDAEHKVFSRRFGPFAEDAYTVGVRGHPEVQPVIKEADDTSAMVFGSGWHTDSPFLRRATGDQHAACGRGAALRRRYAVGELRAGVSHAERHHASA